jgi:hypothetical protein
VYDIAGEMVVLSMLVSPGISTLQTDNITYGMRIYKDSRYRFFIRKIAYEHGLFTVARGNEIELPLTVRTSADRSNVERVSVC